MTPRPSKRAVMEALADVLVEPNWTLHENEGPRGYWSALVRIYGNDDMLLAKMSVSGHSRWQVRRRMIELCENFHGGPRL